MFKYLEMLLLVGFLYRDIWIELLNHSVYIIYQLLNSLHNLFIENYGPQSTTLIYSRGRCFLDVQV